VNAVNHTLAMIETTDDLLRELRDHGPTSGTYAEIEDALIGVMSTHQREIPPQMTARDVLIYAHEHGLIARRGGKVVLLADS
jgi:hypothetical protein